MEYPQLDLDLQLCFPLYATSRALTRQYTELLAETGLTYPQYLTMLALWGAPVLTVSEVGERLQLDSGTLTPLLKRLESAGLVTRRRDTTDERRVIIEVTDAGRELRHQVADVPLQLFASLGLEAQEWADLRRILDKLLASLAKTAPRHP